MAAVAQGTDVAGTRFVIVMGVSGCGKTTIAALLAGRLGWDFEDGDWLHPPANLAKMASGRALDDADRQPWLAAIAGWMDERRRQGRRGVVACSALKRAYRARLLDGADDVRLVYLRGGGALIARRIAARHGHFMPAQLLESQFAALEEPGAGEAPIIVPIDAAPAAIVAQIIRQLDGGGR